MIGVIDYGMGNLGSVLKAFETLGLDAGLIRTPEEIDRAERLVLPGVGAFGRAMENLRERKLVKPLRRAVAARRPLLGICLGLQLLFESSEEHGLHEGLGVFPGKVRRLPNTVKIPHIGWNQLQIETETALLDGVPDRSYFYFVQSFYVEAGDPSLVLGTTDYGLTFASMAGDGVVFGVQFHPEKSQKHGLKILKNFGGLPC